jgi:Zn finger protein HypA/HybF involved in hydrogenase expression
MHEHHLVQSVIAEALKQVPPGKTARRVTVSLSPDAHMDETSVRLHTGEAVINTPLAAAEVVIQPAPPRLYCKTCDKESDRRPGVFECPLCGGPGRPAHHSSGLRLVSVEIA